MKSRIAIVLLTISVSAAAICVAEPDPVATGSKHPTTGEAPSSFALDRGPFEVSLYAPVLRSDDGQMTMIIEARANRSSTTEPLPIDDVVLVQADSLRHWLAEDGARARKAELAGQKPRRSLVVIAGDQVELISGQIRGIEDVTRSLDGRTLTARCWPRFRWKSLRVAYVFDGQVRFQTDELPVEASFRPIKSS